MFFDVLVTANTSFYASFQCFHSVIKYKSIVLSMVLFGLTRGERREMLPMKLSQHWQLSVKGFSTQDNFSACQTNP